MSYTLTHGPVDLTSYKPAPGSQLSMSVPAGTVSSFEAAFDIGLVKDFGLASDPDTLHLTSEFEAHR